MRNTLIALSLAFSVANASATGFEPWNDRTVDQDQSFDTPADITMGPFYRTNVPNNISKTPDQVQPSIDIRPYNKRYA